MTLTYAERLRGALAEQHKKCFDQASKRLKPEVAQYIDCPVCDSARKKLFFEKDWFTFFRCEDCSMVYLNPRLNDRATYEFYNSEWNAIYNETKFDAVSEPMPLDDQLNDENLREILRFRGGARGNVLEIGSAKGFFLRKAKEAGFSIHGLELNEKNCERTRRELGPTILNADLFSAKFPADMFDVVYMRDVFEHVPNPKAMLTEFHRIARPGCVVFIEVPNIDGLIYRLVKARHVCVFGFEHLNYWSATTLARVLRICGFEVRKTTYQSLDFSVREVLRTYFTPAFTTLYPQPTSKPVERIFRLLYRLSGRHPLGPWDQKYMPALANVLRVGSVVRVLAEKT